MPRQARGKILYDGCFAHVYSRAFNNQLIFCDEEDFEFFKDLIKKAKRSGNFRLHHYCLMNTHFHMLVSLERLELFSKGLKQVKEQYATRFKRKYGRKGPVWWGRFGSQLIENERYLYACGLYIEMNPVEAGLVNRAEGWKYSSSRHYFSGEKEDLIDDYQRPSFGTAQTLMEGLNVGRGSYIGTSSFLLNHGSPCPT